MQHEGLRRRRRGSAQGPGTPPHCHVRRRNAQGARISRPIRSHGAGGGKPRPFQTQGRRGKSLQSEVQKEKVRLCQPIRGWGMRCVCAHARALRPILGGHGKASGLSGLCGQALSGCPVFARRGRVAPRLDQSNGGAGRMRAAPDARGEGEVWARPRPGFIKARSGATRALVASAVPAAPT